MVTNSSRRSRPTAISTRRSGKRTAAIAGSAASGTARTDEIGFLVHKPGGPEHARWVFDYDQSAEDDDESGYRFGAHVFRAGRIRLDSRRGRRHAHLPGRLGRGRDLIPYKAVMCGIEPGNRSCVEARGRLQGFSTRTVICSRSPSSPGRRIPSTSTTVPPPPQERRRRAGARAGARRLRHRPRDRRRRLRLGAARRSERLILGHESLGRVEEAPAGMRLRRPAISSSASCAGPIRCRARPAPPANGTCAATAATPSAASRSATATAPSVSASSRISPSRSIRRSACSACCSSRPASSPRPGTTSSASASARASWQPHTLLVTGAGPVGLLAALIGAQRGLEVHVLDRDKHGPKPELVRDARRAPITPAISATSLKPDIVIECTGAPSVDASTCSAAPRRTASSALPASRRGGHKIRCRYRRAQPQHGARQRRRVRLGQRQPPALRRCRRGAGARPTSDWLDAPDHAPRAARRAGARRSSRSRTTSKSSSISR